jgi:hypothetical protein
MKRARLTAVPVKPATEPPDLTDRLLETGGSSDKAPSRSPASTKAKPAARASTKASRRPGADVPAEATPQVQAAAGSSATEATDELEHALRQAQAAAEALQRAARGGQARYELGMRYRLDALAHHLRQVAEFVALSRQR